jgi:hypothetical protein
MMGKTRIEIKNPCPYCGSKNFSYEPDPYYMLLAIHEGTPNPVVNINEGRAVIAVTCKECGHIMLFSSNLGK